MGRTEFLDKLNGALNGRVSSEVLQDTVRYYDDYIMSQIRMGSSEEQVLSRLGDPRLLAKTVITANHAGEQEYVREEYSQENTQDYSQENTTGTIFRRRTNLPTWAVLLIIALVFLVIIGLFISILSFLLPILFPFLVVIFLVKLFRDWLR